MSAGGRGRRLDRRELLLAVAVAAGGAAVGAGWWLGGSRGRLLSAARGWVPEELEETVERFGAAYLADHPNADAEALWRRLEERAGPWPAAGLADAGLRARLRHAVEADFAAEATVDVAGLQLAETTASLCALYALAGQTEGGAETGG